MSDKSIKIDSENVQRQSYESKQESTPQDGEKGASISEKDLGRLEEFHKKIESLQTNLGMIEEQKMEVINVLQNVRQSRQKLVEELEIRYDIPNPLPEGVTWRINYNTREIIYLDQEGNQIAKPEKTE